MVIKWLKGLVSGGMSARSIHRNESRGHPGWEMQGGVKIFCLCKMRIPFVFVKMWIISPFFFNFFLVTIACVLRCWHCGVQGSEVHRYIVGE